jgi:hypothetical protein
MTDSLALVPCFSLLAGASRIFLRMLHIPCCFVGHKDLLNINYESRLTLKQQDYYCKKIQ